MFTSLVTDERTDKQSENIMPLLGACTKFVRIVRASTYDEYFGQKMSAVGSKVLEEISLARGTDRR